MQIFKGIKSAVNFVCGSKVLKRQTSFIKQDMSHFKSDFLGGGFGIKPKVRVDEWNKFISLHGVSAQQLKNQYSIRRGIAILMLIALAVCFYFIFIRSQHSVGLACFIMTSLLYFCNNFRLYQIRHQQLCTVSDFLKRVRVNFKELLPLRLSQEWHIIIEQAEHGE